MADLEHPGAASLSSSLRRRWDRTRRMGVGNQLRDAVDYLENPEVLVAEFVDAYCAIDGCADPDELILEDLSTRSRDNPLFRQFAPGTEVSLDCTGGGAMRVLRAPVPLLGEAGAHGADYVGLIQGEAGEVPVIGAVQSGVKGTPYSLLLRALVCLSEIAPAPHLARLNEEIFKGGLQPGVQFDLHLGIVQAPETAEEHTLWQLTRDMADGFCAAIGEEWQFPDLLRRIWALRIDPHGEAPPGLDWVA